MREKRWYRRSSSGKTVFCMEALPVKKVMLQKMLLPVKTMLPVKAILREKEMVPAEAGLRTDFGSPVFPVRSLRLLFSRRKRIKAGSGACAPVCRGN